jgi:RNA polymerase sigma-70 factor (ECF subfamily)
VNPIRFKHLSDGELLERYHAEYDQQMIGVLLERYTLLLFGVCMKYLKNEEEAKDCVQQIFLKVLSEVTKYRIDYFKSWLYMVAKNQCLMRIRSLKGKQLKELNEEVVSTEELEINKAKIEDEKKYQLLEQSMQELNDEQRQCVILFYLHKKSYNEIAEKTGYNLMQVKSYIQNGKRNLKLMMEQKLKVQ